MGADNAAADTLVLLVDGDCKMCNWCVRFIAERDVEGVVYFETQQSEVGQRLLEKYKQPRDLSTVVLIEKRADAAHAACYTKSSAMLRVFGRLNCPWSGLSHLTFIPPFLRDTAYDCVAYSRYAMFGRTETCGLPSSSARARIKRAVPEF